MNPGFWQQKWEKNEIGFHEGRPNSLLVTHFNTLGLTQGARVFLPLCGKTVDIVWLLSKGYRVAGAELSQLAIKQLFTELGITPAIATIGKLLHYSAANIDIFIGDIFDLSKATLGQIDASYDRAALVALPEPTRAKYTKHLLDITDKATQLLLTFEYDQSLMDGPPFSLSSDEIRRRYQVAYQLTLLESRPVAGGMKGLGAATESAWLLKK
ncbi:MAG: thiopurine S-methyltransferase [Steroidobacteraceae bacterium]